MSSDSTLFEPITVGDLRLSHRIVMAPLTRFRADAQHVHQPVAAEYYSQRASTPGTLLITEATFIDPKASGYANVPGIWNDEQVQGWKRVVEAVHAKGCKIFLQLWALGRAADADNLREETGEDVQSASDVAFEGGATPRPLTKDEIKDYVLYYARAAKKFVEEAGGDGCEVHNANGCLLDQFLQTVSNKRTDEYGGSVENRARFPLEVLDAVCAAIGPSRIGVRLSPYSPWQGMGMPQADVDETFGYYVRQVRERHSDLAYLHCVTARMAGILDVEGAKAEQSLDFIRDLWSPRPLILAGGFDTESARVAADSGENTLVEQGEN
ncbi:hypothetical protein DMC30DRAFT_446547 [Rhodotorula diobovata]|uniref:NADH:flavin oxidoreductase/NADH oxidase N-terminal domain-containing protein n=1 Tax=Rhodotorula diobovata TaxID=5288 RepID=A0A5C5FVT1_9BASI|nr:hypothetical protein DMC30DRAFT_446547 [Rhodotorula diobovata]